MFHIFTKTYIDIDAFINLNLDRVVISKTNGFPVHDQLDKMFLGRLFAYGNEVSDVIGPDKMFPSFGDMMNFFYDYNESTGKKVVLYCDQEAYMKIMSLWLKSIFVSIDADSAYRIIKAYFCKQVLLGTRSVRGLEDQYHTFLFPLLDFTNTFNNTSVDSAIVSTLVPKMTGSRSMEFLLGSYMYDGSHKNELKDNMYNIIRRHVEEFLKEAYRGFQENALKSSFSSEFNLRVYTIDNLLEILNDPQLEILKNTNSWRSMGGVSSDATRTDLDLTKLTSAQINLIKGQTTFMNGHMGAEGHPNYDRSLYLIDICHQGGLTDAQLDWLIDPANHPVDDTRWWSIKDRENLNLYIMEYFFEEFRQNRTANLKPYLLR